MLNQAAIGSADDAQAAFPGADDVLDLGHRDYLPSFNDLRMARIVLDNKAATSEKFFSKHLIDKDLSGLCCLDKAVYYRLSRLCYLGYAVYVIMSSQSCQGRTVKTNFFWPWSPGQGVWARASGPERQRPGRVGQGV